MLIMCFSANTVELDDPTPYASNDPKLQQHPTWASNQPHDIVETRIDELIYRGVEARRLSSRYADSYLGSARREKRDCGGIRDGHPYKMATKDTGYFRAKEEEIEDGEAQERLVKRMSLHNSPAARTDPLGPQTHRGSSIDNTNSGSAATDNCTGDHRSGCVPDLLQ
jgi:hypothetical protein